MSDPTRRRPESRDQRGSMAIEMVILAPIFVMFALLVVAGGRYVMVRGDVDAAARDAVRAASYERDGASALAAARQVAAQATAADCGAAQLHGRFEAGGSIEVRLECRVSLSGLGLIGMPGSARIEASSTAPLDYYRRTG